MTVSNHNGSGEGGIPMLLGRERPKSSYSSTTATNASFAFSIASPTDSPSVASSGSNGEVTAYPPSDWGVKTRGIL